MPRKRRKQGEAITNRKGGKRKGAGRPKSTTTIERERDVRATVLNQPHRRGMALEWLCSPVGRILASSSHLLPKTSASALHDSANRFAESYSKWQAVASSARPFANSTAGSHQDISTEQAARFTSQWSVAWSVLRHSGERQEKAVFMAVIEPQPEDWTPPFWVVYGCIEGLKVLATHYGIDFHGEDRLAA